MWCLLLLVLVPVSPHLHQHPLPPRDHPPPPALWFRQILDHDNIRDNRSWLQRYWITKEHHKPGGPSLLMIGGEGEASPHWLMTGTLVEYARQHGAAILLLEHRFYGQSRPTNTTSVKSLALLSSRQALADLANFIVTIREEEGLSGPWVALGGSYPGSLAGWLRLKYPHLVVGAVATSGPVAAKEDFMEYLQVVQEALDTFTPSCSEALQESVKQLTDTVAVKTNWQQVSTMFNLCSPWDGGRLATLVETLLGSMETAVQYNNAGEGINSTTGKLCSIMTNTSLGTEMERLGVVTNTVMGADCLETDYTNLVKMLKKTDYTDPPARVPGDVGNRQWFYQTCTEFGWYQTSSQPGHPFGWSFPVEFFTSLCQEVFGRKFGPKLLRQGIQRTLREYGGRDLAASVSNVVFVHGSLDPWHALGITSSTSPTSPSILIPGTSHCANLYPETEQDPSELKEARKTVGRIIGEWVSAN